MTHNSLAGNSAATPILEVQDLHTHFVSRNLTAGPKRMVRAVDGVSFRVWPGDGKFRRIIALTHFTCAPIWSGPPVSQSQRTTWFIHGFARLTRRRHRIMPGSFFI